MGTVTNERPGVYSSYEASKVTSYGSGSKAVGIVAMNEVVEAGAVYEILTPDQGLETFGSGVMADMISAALENGAVSVSCTVAGLVAVEAENGSVVEPDETGDEELETVDLEFGNYFDDDQGDDEVEVEEQFTVDYASAFALLEKVEGLSYIVCDSTDLEVQQLLRNSVVSASAERKERLAVVMCEPEAAVLEVVAQASELNCERVVLLAGQYVSEADAGVYVAAFAGMLAQETDPALPVHGLALEGVSGLEGNYVDAEIDALIRGGVTPLELGSGIVTVVRAVTTCTTVQGVADTTWKDLTTIMVVDDVIPSLRDSLRVKFQRSKNTEQTRGAVNAQVVLELEEKLSREIIVEYSDVTVEQSSEDGSVCLVSFSFAVAHGLNQIWLNAFVQV